MTKPLIRVFIGLSLVLVTVSFIYAQSENYCHDQKSWNEWDALAAKNPNDMEVQALYGLRIGLCVKVDRGGITLSTRPPRFLSLQEKLSFKSVKRIKKKNRVDRNYKAWGL